MKSLVRSLTLLSFLVVSHGFSAMTPAKRIITTTRLSAQPTSSRRQWFLHTTAALFTLTANTAPSNAASTDFQRTVYITGKPPIVPGQSSKSNNNNNNNTQGTRKDPNFLRSISDCKSQCELQGNKSKEDCLSECQDICCKTYEQCTFAIVPRI